MAASASPGLRPWRLWTALRPHQWVKNLLLAVPLVVGHRVPDSAELLRLFLAMLSFSLAASAVYLLNDLFDLEADRRHPHKRHRPLASGELSAKNGILLCVLLVMGAAAIGYFIGLPFMGMLLGYFILSNAYSAFLKTQPILDVLVLAGLYTWRLLTGGLVVNVMPSTWLLAFSMFLFLSLAMLKRYAELRYLEDGMGERGYLAGDVEWLSNTGISAGYMAVLVMALYINSKEVVVLYSHPELLWFACPVLFYWITRMWLLAHRGKVIGDPIVVALRDRVSVIMGVVLAVLLFIATRI